ncbi:NADP-dependent oxidoreductase [Saccharothrix carnea]|uniref:NADP-dependent oxidoreductase n=1 Tax=Saccharothrix carnea TaxID=1280637 RepID=UPI003182CA3A
MTFSTYGPPEVLKVVELAEPTAGAGQVRVRVKAAGVMPFDVRAREGGFPTALTGDFPIVPGNEFAGVVDQVGEGVDTVAVGDAVLGFATLRSYAEFVVVSADQVVAKPSGMPWEVAGAFSGAAQGAHMALEQMKVAPGETVLVNGAAGGLGTMTVQLAARRGAALVIGTAHPDNHEYLRALGAVPVAYGDGLVDRVREVAPDGVDGSLGAAVDGLKAAVAVTKDIARVVTMVHTEEIAALGVHNWTGVRSAARLTEMVDLYRRGLLHVHLRAVYPVDSAVEAHRDAGSGHGRGKVVLTLG